MNLSSSLCSWHVGTDVTFRRESFLQENRALLSLLMGPYVSKAFWRQCTWFGNTQFVMRKGLTLSRGSWFERYQCLCFSDKGASKREYGSLAGYKRKIEEIYPFSGKIPEQHWNTNDKQNKNKQIWTPQKWSTGTRNALSAKPTPPQPAAGSLGMLLNVMGTMQEPNVALAKLPFFPTCGENIAFVIPVLLPHEPTFHLPVIWMGLSKCPSTLATGVGLI
ncbi:hypothetical protein CB1_000568016 [Camelus ferus]|nr:hypothetical protein CB1_000568016 [Camelus ferus]